MLNFYVFRAGDTERRRKNSWKMGPFKSSGVGKRKEREEDTARLRVSGLGRKGRRKEERKARDVFFTLRKQTALLLQREGKLERAVSTRVV